MILVIDNYDSFTYNLVQMLGMMGETLRVVRNDAASVEECLALNPERIVISPGPGRPEDAGISVELVRRAGARIPILGVCLGHQAIAVAYGGKVMAACRLMHGKSDRIHHSGRGIFTGMADGFEGGRYHSLAVDLTGAPDLSIEATSDDGTVMAIAHRRFAVWGIQFHPESILTPEGPRVLKNFLQLSNDRVHAGKE